MAVIDNWDIHANIEPTRACIERARTNIAEAILRCSETINLVPISIDTIIREANRAAALHDLAAALAELKCTERDA